MDHPKFVAGDMTTAFIAEEYPEGFKGVDLPEEALRRIAAGAAAMRLVTARRASRMSGVIAEHDRNVPEDWVVHVGGHPVRGQYHADGDVAFAHRRGRGTEPCAEGRDPLQPQVFVHGQGAVDVAFADGPVMRVEGDWTPGDRLTHAEIDGQTMSVKVDQRTEGFRIRYRGADLDVKVRTPRAAELAELMPEKVGMDTSKMLLCPMPGVVVSIAVAEGDEVEEGQALATVEAMKMENVLRAEKKAVVKKINAAPGASLAVDDVIMEFA